MGKYRNKQKYYFIDALGVKNTSDILLWQNCQVPAHVDWAEFISVFFLYYNEYITLSAYL